MTRIKKSAPRAKALKALKAIKAATLKKHNIEEELPVHAGRHIDSFIYFGSGMAPPYNKLSNFNACTITGRLWIMTGSNEYVVKEYTFPSSEHLWWAHFLVLDRDIKRLAIGGDLSTLESGLALFYKGGELSKKISYWSKKENVGIVAKMLGGKKRKRAIDLGMKMSVHPCEKYGRQGTEKTLDKIWKRILVAKYTQNSEHRDVLLGTGSHALVEFTRTPKDRIGKEFWCGRAQESKLYGRNYMGDCLVAMREYLKRSFPAPLLDWLKVES